MVSFIINFGSPLRILTSELTRAGLGILIAVVVASQLPLVVVVAFTLAMRFVLVVVVDPASVAVISVDNVDFSVLTPLLVSLGSLMT